MKTKHLHRLLVLSCLLLIQPCIGSGSPLMPENSLPTNKPLPFFATAITHFSLIDAALDKELFVLREGAVINAATLGNRSLSIRANHFEGEDYFVVDFKLTGPVTRIWRESVAPYALFGDTAGNYAGKVLPQGKYSLEAVANFLDVGGGVIHLNTISIDFEIGTDTNEILGFNLIDALNDQDLDGPSGEYGIRDRQVFDIGSYPFSLNGQREVSVKALTNSYDTGSVSFSLQGPVTYSRTENTAPFTLFGDQGGSFNGKVLPPGDYSLTVTPYSLADKKGIKGNTLLLRFTLSDLPDIRIQEFISFIRTDTDQEILFLSPYKKNIIDSGQTSGELFTLVAHAGFPENDLGSVRLELQGPVSHTRIENLAPYALFGDTAGDFQGRALPPGQYTLKATPYTGPGGSGEAGLGYTYDILVMQQAPLTLARDGLRQNKIALWPNPAQATGELQLGQASEDYRAVLYDLSGRQMGEYLLRENTDLSLDVSALPKGIYFFQFSREGESFIRKLVLQ